MKGKIKRQLAAVMFADIVGYTAMMQKDEAAAGIARKRHREVFQQQHELHNGNIIQYYGDGVLSVFKSAIEAVKCATEIQRLLQSGNSVPLRIGLHMGDIVFDKTEVYGDGVNLASRIEQLGVDGAILLSGKLNDELKNHNDISSISLGSFEFKNVSQPVEVFAISNEGIKVPTQSELKGKGGNKNTAIAVLPFANMSGDGDFEYFSDGITEEIINALAKLNSLQVTSRTSSFFFKNKQKPIGQIAKELSVGIILEGSVRVAKDTVRITAQLIQAKNDFHFWSETWDRKLENIFEVQDEISLLIADKLREQFGHFEISDHLAEKKTENFKAFDYSLKAKYIRNKWNPEDAKAAISLYEKALELDPTYDEPYVGLADCYSFLGTTGFMPFEEAWQMTSKYTNKAIELNDQSSGAHYQLSNLAFFVECDYGKSLKEMKKAIELNPNNAEAHQFISFLYIIAGEQEKSNQHLDLALSLNPLSEETHFFRAYYYYMIEEFPKSLELLDKCLSANDKNIPAHSIKPLCLLKLGRYDEVISYFDNIPSDVVVEGEKVGAIALAYALKKDKINASTYFERLIAQAKKPNGYTEDSYIFLMHAVNGNADDAFNWVVKAIENNSSLLFLRYPDPLVGPIKNDPRYAALKRTIYQTDIVENVEKEKVKLLDESSIQDYSRRLLDYMSTKQPYLYSDVSLRDLGKQIDIHPNHLSWLLNNNLGKNFNEFINHYRIEYFKTLAQNPDNSHLSILGLAYESGFNSKTVFNTYFKKEVGMTPKEYIKKYQS
jgi:TolB-like protein/AraC-like DNA-binding protein/Tfp pilus assembly protein PilF